jgi:hypothetical protein
LVKNIADVLAQQSQKSDAIEESYADPAWSAARGCHTARMEPAPRMDTSAPSDLRLVAFVLTAVGALAIGVGSVLTGSAPASRSHSSRASPV